MQLSMWINAFIPKDVPNYTQKITQGKHIGKTAVPLPNVSRLNPVNWTIPSGAGYLTDQRSFDSSITASHRMQSLLQVELGPKAKINNKAHTSSGTTEVVIATGKQTGFAYAKMGRCRFFGVVTTAYGAYGRRVQVGQELSALGKPVGVGPNAKNKRSYLVRVQAAAGDPLISAAADIDYVGNFVFSYDPANPKQCDVMFEGYLDEFPAFECYAELNGTTKTLFTSSPPAGNTVVDLLGFAKRPISGSASFP